MKNCGPQLEQLTSSSIIRLVACPILRLSDQVAHVALETVHLLLEQCETSVQDSFRVDVLLVEVCAIASRVIQVPDEFIDAV